MQHETIRAIIRASLVASRKDNRLLENILITTREGMVRIVACDACSLVDLRIDDQELANAIGDRRYLAAPAAVTFLKTHVKQGAVNSEVTNECIMLDYPGSHLKIYAETSEFRFADIEGLIPEKTGDTSVSLDAEKLLRLVKAMQRDNKTMACRISFTDPQKALVVKCSSGFTGVLMPIRWRV